MSEVAPGVANDVLELDSGLALPLVDACVREVDLACGSNRLSDPASQVLSNLELLCRSMSSPSFRTRSPGSVEQRPLAAVLGSELDLRLLNYRDTTPLTGGQVDDEPYGGGAGMVLRVDVVAAALDATYGGRPEHRVIALTPQGRQLDQALVEELAGEERVTILSARFEGFDERIVEHLATEADLDRPVRPLRRRAARDGRSSTRSRAACRAR